MPHFGSFQYQERGIPLGPIVAPTIGYAIYPDVLYRVKSDVARTAVFEALQPPVVTVNFYEAVYPDSLSRAKSLQNQRNYYEPLAALFVPNDITNVYPDRLVRRVQEARFEEFNSPFINPQIPQPDSVYPNQLLRARRPGLSEEFNSPFTPPAVVPTWYQGVYPDRLLRRGLLPANIPSEFKAHTGIIAPTIGYADYPNQFTAHYTKRRFERNWRPVAVIPPLPPNESGNVLLACINITETFEQHFTSRGWANPQAQITAGYDLYIEPSETSASYQEVFDFGSIISNIIVVVDWNAISVVGSVDTSTSTIETSSDGITWSAPSIATSVFAASVRFVRLTLNFVGASDKSLSYYYNLRCLLNVHREQDGGQANVLAADVGGTIVTLNKAFKSIDSITVTPVNTVEQKAIYDFSFPVNPTTFKVLLYNAAGARVNGTITWIARGIF